MPPKGRLRYAVLVREQSIIFKFWGKAQPQVRGDGPDCHPLVFHCLDVAAVGQTILKRHDTLARRFASLLNLGQEDTVRLLTYLLCIHDIGKFAKKFQAKAPEHFPACFDDAVTKLSTHYDHAAGGFRLFEVHPDLFGLPDVKRRRAWRPLISATTGHHGAPPALELSRETMATLRPDFGPRGIEAAADFAAAVRSVLDPPPRLSDGAMANTKPASFAVAGLAVLADWIGSRQAWFPYRALEDFADLGAYWRYAGARAERAVAEAGILPANVAVTPATLISTTAKPTPMQEWARSVEIPQGPALFVIEDETGSGKTEAALMLAHRLMATRRADGFYVALPTMATANAMFDRLANVHAQLFAADQKPSVSLVHGARDMHQRFRPAMPGHDTSEQPYSAGSEAYDVTATSACADWIADDRRRAFLADVGTGTVDQALLSILPSRHQSLRLLGLMSRVLILDEVHAYDAYMQREMETLLTFQAALGGSAILLSATLPLGMRKHLIDAFAKGLGASPADQPVNDDGYPLATVFAADRIASTKRNVREGGGRALPVRTLRSADAALAELVLAAKEGKAALYIRNTVDDALEAYAELAAQGVDVSVFHARFALVDRLDIERRVVETFGKRGTPERRQGKVLVATQIVEQSLDLDFDVMVTDLAPIDLIIQRAGRLWRHERPEREGNPELVVVGPDPISDAKVDWFAKQFPRAARVYQNHALLWLTAKVLEERGEIDSPHGLRSLIEAVYRDDVEPDVPDSLLVSFHEADGNDRADRGVANTATLALSNGYLWDGGVWENDVRAVTRLDDDPQVTLRLGTVHGDRIEPYGRQAADEDWRAWRLSEVKVPLRRVSAEDPTRVEGIQAAKTAWTRYDLETVLVPLKKDVDGHLSGTAMAGDETGSRRVALRYDPERGLLFDAQAGEKQARQ